MHIKDKITGGHALAEGFVKPEVIDGVKSSPGSIVDLLGFKADFLSCVVSALGPAFLH